MKYEYLEQDYIDDVIAGALHGREQEHFHYALDLANFQDVLKASNDPELRADMESRIAAITKSLDVVDKIYAALLSRIVDPARHARAVARCAEKRALEAQRENTPTPTLPHHLPSRSLLAKAGGGGRKKEALPHHLPSRSLLAKAGGGGRGKQATRKGERHGQTV